ncbi:MAG: carbamoyltransferase HypF [Fuerstiella sp.]
MPPDLQRHRINVEGIVQGVGFRPFIHGLALKLQLTGAVWNHSSGVTIEAEGRREALLEFARRLSTDGPALARIDNLTQAGIPIQHSNRFVIVGSTGRPDASTPIAPDMAPCDACLSEMRDPANRRYRYPFINCTSCGPRFTIIRDVPYDRPATTMASFTMCSLCEAEYQNPADRRFHAQPNACPQCGPQIRFVDGRRAADHPAAVSEAMSAASAIRQFDKAMALGRIVAVKGIGGFHLACDATNDDAVAELRRRKRRGNKPFAVMVADLGTARQIARLTADEESLLTSPESPVVLLRRRRDARIVSPLVAPGNDSIGLMLPCSPLHHLLLEHHAALVMTSGNLAEEPIVRTNSEAEIRLASLADDFLLHDRPIHVVCDDSVIRPFAGRSLPIRRSRGFAPLPLQLASTGPSVLAVGGELKAVFCLTRDRYAYLSQHIGDMANLETLQAFQRSVEHFTALYRIQPLVVACDRHPGYLSTTWAKDFADDADIPLVTVQHHHAHIESVRAEHHCREPVIGICFDGTGYGTDGAIWGGEVLQVDDEGFSRVAHLKYVPLPGGDAAVQRPYRSALAHLWAADLPWDKALPCVDVCPAEEQTILKTQLEGGLNCVLTSSMGRLFDAVSSLIGIRHVVDYEAEAAMELEATAGRDHATSGYRFRLSDDVPVQVDPQPLLAGIVSDLNRRVPRAVIAARFHAAVSEMVQQLSQLVRRESGITTVAISGGVFQNVLLLQLTVRRLESSGFRVLVHREVPPNDGGIALGQAVVAQRFLATGRLPQRQDR